MKKLLLGLFVISTMIAFSGCTATTAKAKSVCVGCDSLPDCVPGPYGDCLPKKK